jgi:hypothetical protein
VGNGKQPYFGLIIGRHKLLTRYILDYSLLSKTSSSVQQALSISDMEEAFHLPLSAKALLELNALHLDLHGYTLIPSMDDKWHITSSKSGLCIPSKIYKFHF